MTNTDDLVPERYWFKINGRSDERISEDFDLEKLWKSEGGQTTSRTPRSIQTDDKLILARLGLLNGKPDYCIYGRAVVAVAHRPGIDVLPESVRSLVPAVIQEWVLADFQRWPYIIWLRDLEIVNGHAYDAPWLGTIDPRKDLIPRKSLSRKSYLRISAEQYNVMDSALVKTFARYAPFYRAHPDGVWWNKFLPAEHEVTRRKLEEQARDRGSDQTAD